MKRIATFFLMLFMSILQAQETPKTSNPDYRNPDKFKQMYDRNNLLINLSMTPDDIKEDIIKKLKNV